MPEIDSEDGFDGRDRTGEESDQDDSFPRTRRTLLEGVGTALAGVGLVGGVPGRGRATSTTSGAEVTGKESFRFLFANTYRFDGVAGTVNEAPARSERVAEFGRIIDEEYDAAALCAVFEDDDRDVLLDSIDADVRSKSGPEGYFYKRSRRMPGA